jgi:hypothetical protein
MNLRGRRVTLRPTLARDAAFVQTLTGGLPERSDQSCSWQQHIIERRSDNTPVGFIEHRTGSATRGWATFGTMIVAGGVRGFGYGSEAVRLIEARLAKDGIHRIRAQIDPRIGLAFYFWLRQGYRPPPQDDVSGPGDQASDIISVMRILKE